MAENYDATGRIRTLVGNWQEEQQLKEVTGIARCKLSIAAGTGAGIGSSTTHEPTFSRVIQHTEQEAPKEWKPQSSDTYQVPTKRSDVLSYPNVQGCGPRQAQELQQMWAQAAMQEAPQPQEPNWETTYRAEHQAKSMEGLQVGCKVMKPDGSPANRDPVFLQETGLVPNAGRLMAQQPAGAPEGVLTKVPSFGVVRGPSGKNSIGPIGGLTFSSVDPAVPITMYTEAAAKMTYNGTFYGTATMGKGLMSRNDQFTKLMGDVNKQQHLL